MPRYSRRQQLLNRLRTLLEAAKRHAVHLTLLGLCTARVEEFIYCCKVVFSRIANQRYLFRGNYRRKTEKFALFLDCDHADSMDEKEFRFHFRMNRETFWELLALVDNHSAFGHTTKTSDSRGPLPHPASHQLLVLLKYYGCDGNQASSLSLSHFFGVSAGSIDGYKANALAALLSLEDRTIIWPDAEERRLISRRIKENYLFPNCIGLIDGTLLPLSQRPLLHGENYLSRKRFYAVVMLVVCDDLGRILYYHCGWPGSVHDNRVWRNCKLNKRCEDFFSAKQYLLGDSAFTASTIMIPPFKSTAGTTLSNNRTAFNTLLAKPRVKSEHCIGILKGRFPFLKGIRLKLGNRLHMAKLIQYVKGTVILHNYLLNDNSDATEWWDSEPEKAEDVEPEPRFLGNEPNYSRRDELFFYFSELEDTTIN
jgi:DDE superfamily endonuclease